MCLWHALMCYRFEGFGIVEAMFNEREEKYNAQLNESGGEIGLWFTEIEDTCLQQILKMLIGTEMN